MSFLCKFWGEPDTCLLPIWWSSWMVNEVSVLSWLQPKGLSLGGSWQNVWYKLGAGVAVLSRPAATLLLGHFEVLTSLGMVKSAESDDCIEVYKMLFTLHLSIHSWSPIITVYILYHDITSLWKKTHIFHFQSTVEELQIYRILKLFLWL